MLPRQYQEIVIKTICDDYNTSLDVVNTKSRNSDYNIVRMIIAYMLHEKCRMTLKLICDHVNLSACSLSIAITRINKLMSNDYNFDLYIKKLKVRIDEQFNQL